MLGALKRISLPTRYAIGFFVLVILVVFGEVYRVRLQKAHEENVRLLRVAERQRSLSQRMVHAALVAVKAETDSEEVHALAELKASIRAWRDGRQAMLEGASSTSFDTPELQQRLKELAPHSDAMAATAQSLIDSLEREKKDRATQHLKNLLDVEGKFFGSMEDVTFSIVNDYDLEVAQILEQDRVRLYIMLAALLLQTLIIAVPAIAIARSAFHNLRTSNVALDSALEETKAAMQFKADFLATTSHELRTPLNAVIGLSNLLRQTELDPRQRQFVETINQSGENLLQLINDILDLSKIEAGKLDLESVEFDVVELVETSVDALALRAESKGIEITAMIAPEVPRASHGDAGRIRQVLLNLLSNAVKFTDSGSVSVSVTQVGPSFLRFAVDDTGPGISEEVQARLFQPFTQADASTTRRYGGTGLGLSISRRLVEMLGGRVGLKSTVGKGSSFWFELPLDGVPREVYDANPPEILRGKRVLVVSPSVALQESVTPMLRAWRMYVQAESTGANALPVLRAAAGKQAPYDLALVDSALSDVAYAALAKSIREDAAGRATKLILIAPFSKGADEVAARYSGFAGVVVKPIHRHALFEALCHQYDRRQTQRPPKDVTPQFPGRRILVADDNSVNALVAKAMLRQMGVTVDVAANGLEVLAACERAQYDLILMDVQMPELDGYGATMELRKREEGTERHISIVAATASAMREDYERCLAVGMDDYISKPIAATALATALERWLPPLKADAPPVNNS